MLEAKMAAAYSLPSKGQRVPPAQGQARFSDCRSPSQAAKTETWTHQRLQPPPRSLSVFSSLPRPGKALTGVCAGDGVRGVVIGIQARQDGPGQGLV